MSEDLENIATRLVTDGKGILAADESVKTLTRRFDAVGIQSTEESRRAYREILFTTTGASEFISGAILYDETIRQTSSDGTPFAQVLLSQNIVPGIKVDTGAVPLAGSPDETVTEGLDGLRDRLTAYHEMGARFAKWRAVIRITPPLPSQACVSANAHALARYAALCQEQHLVPIVEPEVLMNGAHTGKLELRSLADSILADLARMTVRQTITAPLAGALQGAFAGGGLFGLFHEGGIAGKHPPAVRYADAAVFQHAARYHGGGFAGSGLLPDEVPIIARRGELVVPPERVVREEKTARDQRPITVVVNVTAADASSFRASQGQIAADMARAIDRASRNR